MGKLLGVRWTFCSCMPWKIPFHFWKMQFISLNCRVLKFRMESLSFSVHGIYNKHRDWGNRSCDDEVIVGTLGRKTRPKKFSTKSIRKRPRNVTTERGVMFFFQNSRLYLHRMKVLAKKNEAEWIKKCSFVLCQETPRYYTNFSAAGSLVNLRASR